MPRSTRFPVAVHILAILAIKSDEFVGSALIARSVDTNAVVVRRVIGMLAEAGMVVCQPGAKGGAKLMVDPREVSLLEVHDAVEEAPTFRLHSPNAECPVACTVTEDLDSIMDETETLIRNRLASTPLSKLTNRAVKEYKNWKKS